MLRSVLTSSKTPSIIISEIFMMSTTFSGVHLLVEGEEDVKFWKPRVSRSGVSIVNCEGKANLLGASALIRRSSVENVVGVYDPDFERLFGILHHSDFLAPTDQNDLEITIVSSGALNALLHEYADPAQIAEFEDSSGIKVSVYLEQTSREFGFLRYLNLVLAHQVDFDRLSPYRFVSQDNWTLDRVALHEEYARLAGIDVSEVEALIRLHCPIVKEWGMSQGHDTLKILAQGLRRRIGRKQMTEQDVARILRIAFSDDLLRGSMMYKSLQKFERDFSLSIFRDD